MSYLASAPPHPYCQTTPQDILEQTSYQPEKQNPYKPLSRRPFRDKCCCFTFIGQLVILVIIACITISKFLAAGSLEGILRVGISSNENGHTVTLNHHIIVLLLSVMGLALLLAVVYLILLRAFTKLMIHVTLASSIVLNIIVCIFFICKGSTSGASVFAGIAAVFSALFYWWCYSRIPFTAELLKIVMDIAKAHKSVYVVAFASVMLQVTFAVFFIFIVVATYMAFSVHSPGSAAGLIVYETFSFLWTSQVIGNIALVTLAGGPFGFYCFEMTPNEVPKNPTLTSLWTALTCSLGSIAFGSLLVTLVDILRMLCNDSRSDSSDSIVGCLCSCFLEWIAALFECFNRYAYIEIALSGDSYIDSAKTTWRRFKERGVDIVVNDSLVDKTFNMGAFVIGLLCSCFAYLYLHYDHPTYNAEGQYTAPILLFAFLIGIFCLSMLAFALEAGVSTIFVCLSGDHVATSLREPLKHLLKQNSSESRYSKVIKGFKS